MKTKFETREHLKTFISYVETQLDTKIKVIRSDNGFEFNMPSFFNSKGIIHQTTCVETPEQNGIVERKHQHLLNVTRSLLFQTKLSKQFWSYTLINATFLINNIPTPILKNSTPYEKLHNKMYNISSLKVFGCLCFAQTLSAKRSKFDPRARASIFLGLNSHTKGYVIFDLKKHDIIISRNVIFHEDVFPSCHNIDNESTEQVCLPTPHNCSIQFDYNDTVTHDETLDDNNIPCNNDMDTQDNVINNDNVRRSKRATKMPTHLQDYYVNNIDTARKSKYYIQSFLSLSRLSSSFQHIVVNIDGGIEPKNYNEAAKESSWQKAMKDELLALE